jgi:hypothetical protein
MQSGRRQLRTLVCAGYQHRSPQFRGHTNINLVCLVRPEALRDNAGSHGLVSVPKDLRAKGRGCGIKPDPNIMIQY